MVQTCALGQAAGEEPPEAELAHGRRLNPRRIVHDAKQDLYRLVGVMIDLADTEPGRKWLCASPGSWTYTLKWLNENAYTADLGGNAALGVATEEAKVRLGRLRRLFVDAGGTVEDLAALPEPPGKMVAYRVSGAGLGTVNGIYEFDGLFGAGFEVCCTTLRRPACLFLNLFVCARFEFARHGHGRRFWPRGPALLATLN